MVSSFRAETALISIVFDWDPPRDPNGILIVYELSYRVNGSRFTMSFTNVSTTVFTLELAPSTRVSDISVRAYTSTGPGPLITVEGVIIPAVPLPREFASYYIILLYCMDTIFPAVVRNIRVAQVPDSVVVSWDRVSVTGITGYTVYYGRVSGREGQGELSVTVPSTENSVTITGLVSCVEYQVQVVATAEFLGQPTVGERSMLNAESMIVPSLQVTPQPTSGGSSKFQAKVLS